MHGLMQHHSLRISSLIEHAAHNHPDAEIISRTSEGPIHRSSYGEVRRRASQMAHALTRLGVQQGERVATLAWNGCRHLELYYGVSGMGAVLHTINPRLFLEQIEYIVNHAQDQYLFFDLSFAGLVAQLAPLLPSVKGYVAMTDRAHMPQLDLPNLWCYEELLEGQSSVFAWPQLDENAAATLCYTSGTTGNPKGVLYSHRSTVLHAMAACSADGLAVSMADTALMVVPMFHVNGWGLPYSGAMSGARLVLPGPALDGKSIYELLRDEQVTLALGVPTVWTMLFRYIDSAGLQPKADLKLRRCVIGGSAAPLAMIDRFETEFGAHAMHAWGMTEMSPMGTVCRLLPKHQALPPDRRHKQQAKQGRAMFGVTMQVVDDAGMPLPRDGVSSGRLLVRGPWIAAAYYRGASEQDENGYFDTGDIANIDADGYLQITDRSKDVIKSGGEWISSIDLENAALGHPAISEAAVIGIPHPTWQERPLLLAVLKAGKKAGRDELLEFLGTRVAKWWLPDDVVFVEQLPHTATGKLQKMQLREQYKHHQLPGLPDAQ